ncbi:MAG: transglutaminase domain-containing protein [Ruminococcus sp.]|nr:transglutaminase domain-containing protein [Ruminococcus sp.]
MTNFYKEGVSKNLISLLLCVSIITSCMYVYSAEYLPMFIFFTLLIQTTVFSFYTYVSKKSILFRFISILGSFAAICMLVTISIKTGNNSSGLDYFIWFLSPQALVSFSLSYIVATFIVINFFIASTVYYFSAVRYRISMTFLITLIPFAFYRKEGEGVPVFFALLLLVLYIALMINCRHINVKSNVKILTDSGYKKSMAVFLIFSSFLAFIIPKPEIDFDNSWVEDVFESEKFSDYMMARLGVVSDTASSSVVFTRYSDVKIADFRSDEYPLNLKAQTYSAYNFKENLWSVVDEDVYGYDIDTTDARALDPSVFYKAVYEASCEDKSIQEKYGLTDMKKSLGEDYKRSLSLVTTQTSYAFYYTPVLAYDVVTNEEDRIIYRALNGMLLPKMYLSSGYEVKYYSAESAFDQDFQKIMLSLDLDSFGAFLDSVEAALMSSGTYDKYEEVLSAYRREYNNAVNYLEKYSIDGIPDTVKSIAESVTADCSSDIEKAVAIQNYFLKNGFLYDLEYKKPSKYNMEHFLIKAKKGICSDYATAMVLLSRLSGIPARYAEGVKLGEPENDSIITVRDSNLHAFPELYISGYGWMSFEPTQIDYADEDETFEIDMSYIFVAIALVSIIIIVLFSVFGLPALSEKIFEGKVSRSSDSKAIELIFNRIRKVLGLDKSLTSKEVTLYVAENYQIKIAPVAYEFDSVVYGSNEAGKNAKECAMESYCQLRELLKKEKKRIHH